MTAIAAWTCWPRTSRTRAWSNCDTLQTVNPGQTAITPRPFPVKALGALSVDTRGVFTFAWQTEAAWAGTCREVVATADSGRQYRAYYRFT